MHSSPKASLARSLPSRPSVPKTSSHLQYQQHLCDGRGNTCVGAGQCILQLHAEGDGVPEMQQGKLAHRRLLALRAQEETSWPCCSHAVFSLYHRSKVGGGKGPSDIHPSPILSPCPKDTGFCWQGFPYHAEQISASRLPSPGLPGPEESHTC